MNIARALTVAAAAVAIPPDRLRATARAVAGRQRAEAMPSARAQSKRGQSKHAPSPRAQSLRAQSLRAEAAGQDTRPPATDAADAARRNANRTALQASRALLARTIDMLT